MNSPTTSRAWLLYESRRFDLAIKELSAELASNPDNDHAYTLLALSQSGLDKHAEALDAAKTAIRMDPANPYAHYVQAFVQLRAEKPKEAEASALESLRLNPYDADVFGVLANARLAQANWTGALQAAESGLELQADDVTCNNARTRALLKMNRKAEAMVAVDTTLSFDPENAYSHANKGWTLLEARKTDEAITHFKEALRLEPGMEWAKAGLVSALKTKNPFYRVIFDYFLLMSRLPLASRRFVIFGLWAVNQVFVHGAVGNPAIAKVGHIFVPLYLLFCFVTWTADPLMNALLRFHPVGRYALTRKETVGANWVALSLAVSAAFGVAWLAHHRESWSFGAIGFLFVTYLVSITVTRKSKAFTVLAGLASAAVAAYVLFLSFS